jgi:hypothetical protein
MPSDVMSYLVPSHVCSYLVRASPDLDLDARPLARAFAFCSGVADARGGERIHGRCGDAR